MKRAEWLQETRKIRLEEAYGGWQSGHLRQEDAAQLLGMREDISKVYRSVRRWGSGRID